MSGDWDNAIKTVEELTGRAISELELRRRFDGHPDEPATEQDVAMMLAHYPELAKDRAALDAALKMIAVMRDLGGLSDTQAALNLLTAAVRRAALGKASQRAGAELSRSTRQHKLQRKEREMSGALAQFVRDYRKTRPTASAREMAERFCIQNTEFSTETVRKKISRLLKTTPL